MVNLSFLKQQILMLFLDCIHNIVNEIIDFNLHILVR